VYINFQKVINITDREVTIGISKYVSSGNRGRSFTRKIAIKRKKTAINCDTNNTIQLKFCNITGNKVTAVDSWTSRFLITDSVLEKLLCALLKLIMWLSNSNGIRVVFSQLPPIFTEVLRKLAVEIVTSRVHKTQYPYHKTSY
jgi:hypothetical protein